ncbi:hypothetical protein CP532_1062 [Ophiocordyceps camponoti-leonardi (nom. inval.)]|nr:hypothetical protein CP532_1062 [Ophiocordyceps camponoti-leonardi (nom. inval.)]
MNNNQLKALTILLSIGASTWGTSIGIVAPLLASLDKSSTALNRGSITAAYYLGALPSYLLLGPRAADRYGRKGGLLIGTLLLCVGAVIVFVAVSGIGGKGWTTTMVMLLGRCVTGIGCAVVSALVPIYASEVAPGRHRGKMSPRWLTQKQQQLSSSPPSSSPPSPPQRPLLLRAFTLQLMSQLCGATAAKYYFPHLLHNLGVPTRTALFAGAVEMTTKLLITPLDMWAIDSLGRRFCLLAGCLLMAFALLINGTLPLLYPHNSSPLADAICVAFIFIYAFGYSFGLGPASWVYSSEIFPTPVRARGLNWAASGGALGSLVVSFIWPIGLAHLGSVVYFFFMAFNLACVPIIYIFYPETKGRALEDMDVLFAGRQPTGSEDEDAPLLPART